MTKNFWIYFTQGALALLLCLIVVSSCKKDDSTTPATPAALTVSSVKSGMQELLGSSNAADVSITADIVVAFNKEINTPGASDFILTPVGGSPVLLNIVVNGASVTLQPTTDLLRSANYTLSIASSVKAKDGGVFAGQVVLFKTDNPLVPEVTITSIKSGAIELNGATNATSVSLSGDLVVTFSKAVKTIGASAVSLVPMGGAAVSVVLSQSEATLTINPATNLLPGIDYTLTIDTSVRATDEGKFPGRYVVFKTVESVTVTSVKSGATELTGTPSQTNISVSNDLVITFSKAILTPSSTIFELKLANGSTVPFSLSHSGTTVTINPGTDLVTGSSYTLSVSNAVEAEDGGPGVATIVDFKTEGMFPIPQAAHQLAYFGFNGTVNSSVGTWTVENVSSSFTNDRKGVSGSAVSFNGTSDIIEVANGAALFGSSSTCSFWVWADTTSGHGLFCMGINAFKGSQVEIDGKCNWFKNAASFTDASNAELAEDLFFNGDGKFKDNGGWQGHNFNTDLSSVGGVKAKMAMKWVQIVYTYDAATKLRTVYLNGDKMMQSDFNLWPAGDAKQGVTGQKVFTAPAPELSNKFAFGFPKDRSAGLWATESWGDYNNPGANHFKGKLDDVRFFDVALTAAEISTLYNAEK